MMVEVCPEEPASAQRAAAPAKSATEPAGGPGADMTCNIHIPCFLLCLPRPREVIVLGFEPHGGETESLRVVGR